MTIDDPQIDERPDTESHDQILRALVDQVQAMSHRLSVLENTPASATLAPPALPTSQPGPAKTSTASRQPARTLRPTGWQPTRR